MPKPKTNAQAFEHFTKNANPDTLAIVRAKLIDIATFPVENPEAVHRQMAKSGADNMMNPDWIISCWKDALTHLDFDK